MNSKFLIVDDLDENRRLLSRLVRQNFPGADIQEADSGPAAFSLTRKNRPDLVVLDAKMPGMSGFDVCRDIKNDPAVSSTMVLMVSAVLIESKDRVSGLESGADSYICKPFQNEELIAQIRALLRIRNYEQELQKRKQQLEAELEARKRAETELKQAKKAAEVAARAKTEFLAHMSHEIRTPMNAVIGMTSLLGSTDLSEDQQDFVRTISKSGESLLSIINDILDFSKIESGSFSLDEDEMCLDVCIEDVVHLLALKAQDKGLELAYWLDPQVPRRLIADFERLRQVLLNLLGNALKFTDQGEVFLSVCLPEGAEAPALDAEHPEAEIVIRFAVKDTGIGIPEDRVKDLFKAFSQVDSSSTRRFMGTGLGLAISKSLVQLMGGDMSVESVEGQGSTFSFAVRCRALFAPEHAEQQEEDRRLQDRSVLVVDDVATNRRIVRSYAENWGMQVKEATSGEEALQRVRDGMRPDVIVLDMQMPGMDGAETGTLLRKEKGAESAAMVMLASIGISEARQESEQAGIDVFLQKPIRPRILQDAFHRVLGRQVVEAEEEKPQEQPFEERLADQHPLRILLAEDNEVNRKVATLMIGKLGYPVDCAADGHETVEALEKVPYDLVFMDGQMPGMDGYEATQYIRRHWPEDQQPRIVAMTANAMAEDRQRCLDAGMDGYIAKPVNIDEIIKALLATPRRARPN